MISCIFGGFEHLSGSIGWWVMVVQSYAGKAAHLGFDGKIVTSQVSDICSAQYKSCNKSAIRCHEPNFHKK